MIFDTGSSWLVVEDETCTNCVSTLYNSSLSTTFKVNNATTTNVNYASAELRGFTGNDTIALDSSIAVTDFLFFLTTDQQGISKIIDGIMGLGRNYKVGTGVPGPLIYNYLYDAGEISSKVFAFYMGNTSQASYFEIGGYTTAKFRPNSEIVWYSIPDHYFWILKFEGIRFGPNDKYADGTNSSFATPNMTIALIDTGTSFILVPRSAWRTFVENLSKGVDGVQTYGNYIAGPCDTTKWSSIFFYVGGTYMEVTPESYVI
jgi:hypothetical protein